MIFVITFSFAFDFYISLLSIRRYSIERLSKKNNWKETVFSLGFSVFDIKTGEWISVCNIELLKWK